MAFVSLCFDMHPSCVFAAGGAVGRDLRSQSCYVTVVVCVEKVRIVCPVLNNMDPGLPSSPAACSFWFRFVKFWQLMRVTPIETYRAVSITSAAAHDVLHNMVHDSLQQARHTIDEARAAADRNRAKAELLEDRPCPDVSFLQTHTPHRSVVLAVSCPADIHLLTNSVCGACQCTISNFCHAIALSMPSFSPLY